MAFPDLIQYYQAVHLARVLDWCRDGGQKAWVAIEQSCTQIPLQSVPWLRLRSLGTLRHHPLIGATLRVVQLSHLFSKTEGEITRLYPILGNPAFPPGHTDSCFKQTLRQGKLCLGDYLEESRLKTRVEIQSKYRIRHWIRGECSNLPTFLVVFAENNQTVQIRLWKIYVW